MAKRVVIVAFPLDEQVIAEARARLPGFDIAYLPQRLPAEMLRAFSTGTRDTLLGMNSHFTPEFLARLPEAEVVYGLCFPVDLLARAPQLKWVANLGSGCDQYRALGILESGVTLTSSKGVAARSIAEFAMAQLLILTKRFPERFRLQQQHAWKRPAQGDLYGKTMGIVGLGEIGAEVARFAKAFGMRVLATRRRLGGELPPNVDAMYPNSELLGMLPECHAVVLAVALTDDTHGMIGRAQLAAMKKGAYLVNVARGEVVDEAALVEALKNGPMAGAASDVFVQEPLPPDSPLWDLPNLVISSHNAVATEGYMSVAFQRFVAEMERYARGEKLNYVVDPQYGY